MNKPHYLSFPSLLKPTVTIACLLVGFGGNSAGAREVRAFQSAASTATWINNQTVKLDGPGAGIITKGTQASSYSITLSADRSTFINVYVKVAVSFRGIPQGVKVVYGDYNIPGPGQTVVITAPRGRYPYRIEGEPEPEVVIKSQANQVQLSNISYKGEHLPINLNTLNSVPNWVNGSAIYLGRQN